MCWPRRLCLQTNLNHPCSSCLCVPNHSKFSILSPVWVCLGLSFQAATIPGCTGIAISWAQASLGLFSSSVRWGNDYPSQKCPCHPSEGSGQFMCTEPLMQQIKPKAAKSSTPTTHLCLKEDILLCSPSAHQILFPPAQASKQSVRTAK